VQVGRIIKSGAETTVVSRNGREDEHIPRAQIVGKVISVLWRATPGVNAPGVPPSAHRADPKTLQTEQAQLPSKSFPSEGHKENAALALERKIQYWEEVITRRRAQLEESLTRP
jgi:hypothetical protein